MSTAGRLSDNLYVFTTNISTEVDIEKHHKRSRTEVVEPSVGCKPEPETIDMQIYAVQPWMCILLHRSDDVQGSIFLCKALNTSYTEFDTHRGCALHLDTKLL